MTRKYTKTGKYTKSPVLVSRRNALAEQMAALHLAGTPFSQIGAALNTSPSNVKKALKEHGLVDPSAGNALAVARRVAQATARRDQRAMEKWGCSYEQYLMLRRMKKPTRAYQYQKRTAGDRGIGWEFNLWQWWTVWQESGHWAHRGPGQGYVMCRHGDVGPYAVGNVFIAPGIVNCSDRATKLSNLPVGVTAKRKRFVAKRMVDGHLYRLGVYETPELAHAAYLTLGPIGVAA
jgi:hypothetical protein